MNDYWMVHFKYYIRKKLEKQDGHHSIEILGSVTDKFLVSEIMGLITGKFLVSEKNILFTLQCIRDMTCDDGRLVVILELRFRIIQT
jgi:hypothetical protein